jgi:hypothetical protein
MTGCSQARSKFADYLDSRLTGHEMQGMTAHLEACAECSREFEAERQMLGALASLGPVSGKAREPDNMVLRIRVAVSQERAQRQRSFMDSVEMVWRNSVGPFLLQLSAGFASAVLLIGTVALLVGMFAQPEHAAAQDEPLGMATAPRFLYTWEPSADSDEIGTKTGPVVVEVYVNDSGKVYDYRIVNGPTDRQTRAQVEDMLLFSVFEPARFFGQPVRGLKVLSFSGVSVRG